MIEETPKTNSDMTAALSQKTKRGFLGDIENLTCTNSFYLLKKEDTLFIGYNDIRQAIFVEIVCNKA